MCGRYYIDISDAELQEIVRSIEEKRDSHEQLTFKRSGEIFPTDIVPVQTGLGSYDLMKWGFIGFNGKPVINARSETALEKPMFKQSMLERRCLAPASGYYEWKKDGNRKTKYRFCIPHIPIYLAGCWRREKAGGLYTFVILTQPAQEGIATIHDRMPVIITPDRIETWLGDDPEAAQEAMSTAAELIYNPT